MPKVGRAPVSTYRLQLQPGFGFADAAAVADYLADLGVTHAYLSPILQATPGSTHGYDVVDHSRVSEDLGGEAAFRDMVARFRDLGLGLIVDIVPNHMAVPVPESLNQPLWSVLRDGTGSPFAGWFDVDWAAQDGRLLMPVLGGPLSDCLGDLKADTGGARPVLRYFDHVLPVRPGTEDLPLPGLLDAQHYRLADWHLAATELNWRRFFDISSLIAVRVEDPAVFEATHEVILRLVAEGLIDGLRVDHPDGLADPRGYLRRLAEATGGLWVSTEKILSGPERLPADWPCAGTTGYDALGVIGGLFLDPAGAAPLAAAYERLTAGPARFAGVAEAAKREEAGQALAAEVSRLARLAGEAGHPGLDGLSADDRATVLTELLTAMPVYRAYVVPGELAPAVSAAVVDRAAGVARTRLPGRLHAALDAVADLVLGRAGEHARLIVTFQQVCGPVMAKGVEDTAFYRWSRLAALNEVGGDPDSFGTSPEEFHEFAARLARDWPASMTTLSTHDTKRQEDVRARLAVLAEIPQDWAAAVTGWHERAAALDGGAAWAGGAAVGPDTEYLMWQTLAGAWPLDRERLTAYLRKAMREAKDRTSWTDPDAEYESRCAHLRRAGPGGRGAQRGGSAVSWPGCTATRGPTPLAPSWCSSPCPAWPTRTRAASWPGCGWSTRTTGRRPTSPAAGTCWPRWTPVIRRPAWTPLPWTPKSCLSRRLRCGCAGSTRTGSRGSTPRWPPRARRRGTRSASPAAATRSPWPPGCPPGCARAAAGPVPCCPCRTPAPGGTC